MSTLFLSHSSKDREAVLRLAKDLRKRGISVWLDEWEIDVGDPITEKIQSGLSHAQYVAVWLTKDSVNSGWVTKEWHTKIYQEIGSKEVLVLPLLGEKCEIPFFLSDKKYADFYFSYDSGLSELTRALSRKKPKPKPISRSEQPESILHYTQQFLRDLEGFYIPIPTVGNIRIIRSLQSLPRSGKLLRLEGMTPAIPIRSIYDHILSVAYSADCLMPHIETGILGRDRVELARSIAYHDVCEVIIGDIPQYTRLNRSKRNRAHVQAEIRLSELPDGEPERITNAFIAMFLQGSEKYSMTTALETLSNRNPIRDFWYCLDKIDPIIAVWRYVRYCRNIPGFSIDEFLSRMRHFFENPRVRVAVSESISDSRVVDLVDQLQSRENARAYYEDEAIIKESLFEFPEATIRQLIEGRDLQFVTSRKRRTNRSRPSAGSAAP